MGCCNKNKECNNKQSMQAAPSTDTEAFLSLEGGTLIIDKLLAAAKTGICDIFFRDVKLNELASRIGMLFVENEYLKKLVRLLPTPLVIDVKPTTVEIAFGPYAEYTLTVPVRDKHDRMVLADQLFHAAMELKRQEIEHDKQQQLPFSNNQ